MKHDECQKDRARFGTSKTQITWPCAEDCVEHDECKELRKEKNCPSRMIRVGAASEDPVLCTWTTENHRPYIALSHSWGGNIPAKTTNSNKSQRQQIMSMDILPKTFSDAILITRKLGYDYLWIDALCILQDDQADWEIEASKMAFVYSGAVVTISALEATSSSAGIINFDRAPWLSFGEGFVLRRPREDFSSYIQECPRNQRGWVFQERLLSPAILHFGKEQMYWECRTCQENEDGRLSNWVTDEMNSQDYVSLRKNIHQSPEGGWASWYRIVEEYSRKTLSRPYDKLPALDAAAKAFNAAMGKGSYLAGLWEEDLARGMFWQARAPPLSRPPTARAPSWSWAALDGEILYPPWVNGVQQTMFEVRPTVGLDAKLTIRGSVVPMHYTPVDGGLLSLESPGPFADQWPCLLDTVRGEPCSCWVLRACEVGYDELGLVLETTDGGCFRRIGLCTIKYLPWAERRSAWKRFPKSIISVV